MRTATRGELREATLLGIRWVGIARVLAELIAFAAVVLLARMIPPAEFGRAAVALIVQAFATLLAIDGFGTPLVQRRLVGRAHLESAAAMSLLAGLGLTVLTLVLARTVVAPVFDERTATLLALISPAFLIAALAVVPQARLQRELRFRRLSVIDVSAMTVGAVVSVGLALGGLDSQALILGALAAMTASSLLLLASLPLTLPRPHRAETRELATFGTPMAMATMAGAALRNVDYAILGAVMTPAQVGFYYRAFQLGVDYQRKITGVLQRIAVPIYSRTESLGDMRALRFRITRVTTSAVFPLLGLFIVLAPAVVPWLFGDRWEPSVVPAQILAVAGMAAAVVVGAGSPVVAAGRPGLMLAFNAGRLGVYALAIFLAAPYGLTAVCLAVVAFQFVTLLAAQHFLLGAIGVPFVQLWRDIAPAAVATAALVVVAFAASELLEHLGVPVVGLIMGTTAAGAAAYAVVLRLGFTEAWADVRTLITRVLPDRGARR